MAEHEVNPSIGHQDVCLCCGWNPHWDQSPGIIGVQVYHDPAITETRHAWHHDLYRQRERARSETHRAEMFMHNVCEWFEGGYDTMAPEDRRSLRFIWHRDILDKSETPLAALRHFLAQRQAETGDEDEQMSL